MSTYYVKAGDTENNLDLFVNAADEDGAVDGWREYYELDDHEIPERLFMLVIDTTPGPLGWHSPGPGGEAIECTVPQGENA